MNIIKNAKKLRKEDLKNISGGMDSLGSVKVGNPDLSLCGCSCSGSVTGPWYCVQYIACPQVYTCDQSAI
ncbi:hypothetical protein ABXT08_12970 [Chryseobacterium sp. NRRL B-14859]|uniref:hypothetical protein n=1 Tax=unclassified Chryseobacterium TaxID=2593645 RepID=UPI000F4570EE|nr:hypothetical protein [Chryseobacterium sp. G0240]ROI04651.1 hypothetical protein EGI16_08270 [Chryseobacterium sp. G0240]